MTVYLTYALVFAAVGIAAWILWKSADAAGLAASEQRDFENNNLREDGKQKTPLERFVSPGRLFRTQLLCAMMLAALVPSLFILGGITSPYVICGFAVAFSIAGWKLVRFYYDWKVKKRQALFESRILDLTSGLASALRAGMAFAQALDRIAARMDGPMREELAIVLREYRLGLDMASSLDRLVERMPCEDMKIIAASVRLTTKTGGSLADVLADLVEMIRGRRDFAEKLKALTAQGRFEGMMLGVMPIIAFVIFYMIQPEIMKALFTTNIGWMAIGVAVLLEIIGYIVISKITDIKV